MPGAVCASHSSPVSSPSGRGKSRRRLVGGGYSKNNLLRQSYRHLLLGAALLYAGLCYAAHYVYAPRQVLVEDFLYRMLSFACATVLAAIALDCYFLVSTTRQTARRRHPHITLPGAHRVCTAAPAGAGGAARGEAGVGLLRLWAGHVLHGHPPRHRLPGALPHHAGSASQLGKLLGTCASSHALLNHVSLALRPPPPPPPAAQAVPLITNYAGRTVHLVRWVEQVRPGPCSHHHGRRPMAC